LTAFVNHCQENPTAGVTWNKTLSKREKFRKTIKDLNDQFRAHHSDVVHALLDSDVQGTIEFLQKCRAFANTPELNKSVKDATKESLSRLVQVIDYLERAFLG